MPFAEKKERGLQDDKLQDVKEDGTDDDDDGDFLERALAPENNASAAGGVGAATGGGVATAATTREKTQKSNESSSKPDGLYSNAREERAPEPARAKPVDATRFGDIRAERPEMKPHGSAAPPNGHLQPVKARRPAALQEAGDPFGRTDYKMRGRRDVFF